LQRRDIVCDFRIAAAGDRDFNEERRAEVNAQAGMSYQVADNAERHRSHTDVGAKIFIVD
jgi:hypothetical protein